METSTMNPRNLIIPVLLVALATTGCVSLGGGGSSSDSDSGTATASLSDDGRGASKVSDSDIASAIKDAFKQDPQLAAASITVTVEKGVVTLSGNAPNAQTYNRAISVARSAPGVRPPVIATNLKFPL
jgi:osmotically-inducible protein OsmY